ncbi:hypothetical protein VTN49DRAFT_3679 [Thermomyces lanuginosus]|uniref:uncharacterized protein n=1 Tax=Thermomyces lanuginosus TaxID=5541 RepID=UPI0037420C39
MAPIEFLERLKSLYFRGAREDPPPLSSTTAAILSVLATLGYVAPFYLSKSTRPSPTLSRDAPSVIRSRIRIVTLTCIFSTVAALVIAVEKGDIAISEAVRLLGYWPIDLGDIVRSLFLVMILFAGPLFESGIADGDWKVWVRGQGLRETLQSWIGFRNFVAGPVTEEIIFRSVIISFHVLARISPERIVAYSPLYFGIAHGHHFYEFRLTHPETPVSAALFRSVFQFGYTTVFGWLAAFLYLRTGSLPAVILVHSFCNWCGLPRLWGRLEADAAAGSPLLREKEDFSRTMVREVSRKPGIWWTVAYYVILVCGAMGFFYLLWPLTESPHALAEFS